jgi:hypothetical protein
MRITPLNNLPFGYKSVLKTEWLKGNLPTVKYGIYGGKLKPYNVTLEHIRPHSKGGSTELANLALAVDVNNWGRSNQPFKLFFSRAIFDQYCEQFKDVVLPEFDGNKYIEALRKTVERAIK